MKKLLTFVALAVSLGLGSSSHADSTIFGVDTPITKQEVRDNIKGHNIQHDLNDLYLNYKDRAETSSKEYSEDSNDENTYVFGVKINV